MFSKIWTLLKADRHSINILDMNQVKNRFKKISTNTFVVIVIVALCCFIGVYANFMAEQLHGQGDTKFMLAIMMVISLVLSLVNTIHKSQGMLFSSKDNDLLLSLPLEKNVILASRIIKLMLSQYMWSAIILLPSFAVYIYYEGISMSFAISSIVMFVSLPILPVIVGTILGYIVTYIASKFKNKSMMQIIMSAITFVVMFYISFELSDKLNELLDEDIYAALKKIYYPLGLYIESVDSLNILNLLKILAINIIPLILFVIIFSFMYFKIISKLSENHSKSKYKIKKAKQHSALFALVSKEAKRYFRSSIYLLNTIVGPILIAAGAIWLSTTDIYGANISLDTLQEMKDLFLLLIYIVITIGISTANISASAISLEGKSVQLLKSLPLNITNVFWAKILFHFIVVFLPVLVCAVIAAVTLEIAAIDIAILVIASGLVVFMLAVVGLCINILLPKTEASDIAIVKQSASSICSIILGIIYSLFVVYMAYKFEFKNSVIVIGIMSGICALVSCVGWTFLETVGVKKFKKL